MGGGEGRGKSGVLRSRTIAKTSHDIEENHLCTRACVDVKGFLRRPGSETKPSMERKHLIVSAPIAPLEAEIGVVTTIYKLETSHRD
ncbi:hypothetical protein RRG08_023308 [Elysia crispata]|uniref:Uncharacterized protein n=1 Tax=Elysia crispata TaxID=231223 RepID=A0AAE1BCX2_9GAST|nr:hypothetical protein RRG08_023308 [Elysia crispata]